jgi:hypothetical protein
VNSIVHPEASDACPAERSPLKRRRLSAQNSPMPHQFTTSYTRDARDLLRYYKKLGDRAIEQCPDADLFATLDPESNSIAIIVKHMAGNMRSRWTNFLASDGEKPDRHRDTEFETPPQTSSALVELWEAGWKICFDALDPLTDEDLSRTITIRTEPHSVMQAINRQVGHYAHHVGQIVFLAKHFAGDKWQTLSVPKKRSDDFNRRVAAGEASQR